ncbi:MAG: PQQ-binding-like beta-propeller repeat protein [Candidatus Eremiobacteraeota bacterium]|nr:PQQ-binding-like beta-propeller repeat protein [Candidatus Eremiobacteraeota bacterium]
MVQRRTNALLAAAGLTTLLAVGWAMGKATGDSQPAAVVAERPLAMPQSWTQFRLNDAHNPVIDAPRAPAWNVETHGQISASPTVVNGILYVGTNGGVLYAIDAATGRIRWTYRAHNGLKSNPLVYDGMLIVGEGNADSTTIAPRKRVRVGSGRSGILALDAKTGRRRWFYPLTGTGQPTAAIADGVLIHHDGDGVIVALDPRTGKPLYRRNVHTVASMVGAVPVANDLLVTTGIFPNRVMAIHRGSGGLAWKWELSSQNSGVGDCPPASDGETIFCDYLAPVKGGPPVDPGVAAQEHVYALDARSGKLHWDVALESGTVPPRNESAIPLLYHDRLYVGSAVAPYLHAIDPASGKVLWRRRVHGAVKGGVVARAGIVYFGDLQGYLWALHAGSGRLIGARKTSTSFNVGSPIIVGGSLIIGSNTGRISAIPLNTIHWSQDA